MRVGAIILAAGGSRRMGGGDKLLAELAGRPVLAWTLAAFAECGEVDEVVVAASAVNRAAVADVCRAAGGGKVRLVVVGGRERQDSVAAGLAALGRADVVAVHDGARPLITPRGIAACLAALAAGGDGVEGVVAGGPVVDTVKVVDEAGVVTGTPVRSALRAVSTPQVFRAETLREAQAAARRDGVLATDDAGLVERLGGRVRVQELAEPNLKITTPADLLTAEAILQQRPSSTPPAAPPPHPFPTPPHPTPASTPPPPETPIGASRHFPLEGGSKSEPHPTTSPERSEVPRQARNDGTGLVERRTGLGIDSHRFAPPGERPLMLGGVEIPEADGLAGHSDADVLTHAIIDALLGAAGLGDLGAVFGTSDPRWRGASSLLMLAEARRRLAALGMAVESVSAVVIAERPRLRPQIGAMRGRLAEELGLDVSAVNVAATTAEGMGALGRAEGMAAQAVVTVRVLTEPEASL